MRALRVPSERNRARLVEALTLALAGFLALRAPGLGDYPFDAGPALTAIAHGSFAGFFSHQSVMGAFCMYLRAPFVALGAALGDGPMGLYRWGAFPCLLSVAIVAIWLGRVASRRAAQPGRRDSVLLTQVLIAAVCLLNPLVNDALYNGHPEELLTASLAVGALLAASERRALLAAALIGLAVASKQWAVVIALPLILVLEGNRIRALLISGGVVVLATLPMVIGNLASFRNALHYVAAAPSTVTDMTWLYPFSPAGMVRLTSIYGDSRIIAAHRLVGIEGMARPMITLLGVAIPLFVWWRSGKRLSVQQMLLCVPLALVIRCALDPGSEPYYHYPVVMSLLVLDVSAGRRIPVVGLAGAVSAFVVLDRFVGYLSPGLVNAVYIAVTVTAYVLLARALRATVQARGDRGVGFPEPAVA